jgi:xanthine dehydrogenase accessory factor
MLFPDVLVLVRGAGDLATGVLYRLHQAGFPVIATELPRPLVVRRTVAFAQAVYDGECTVEGVRAARVDTVTAALTLAAAGGLPVLPDPRDEVIALIRPTVLVDARLLKRADAARLDQAPLVIGLGPGFTAGINCHAVIETNRGHRLGRVYWQGAAEPDTGIPGAIAGFREERLLRAPVAGVWQPRVALGERVEKGQVVGYVVAAAGPVVVTAGLTGLVRGLLYPGLDVTPGMKLGDIDPRGDEETLFTISDKSLAIGGGVLAAVLTWLNRRVKER